MVQTLAAARGKASLPCSAGPVRSLLCHSWLTFGNGPLSVFWSALGPRRYEEDLVGRRQSRACTRSARGPERRRAFAAGCQATQEEEYPFILGSKERVISWLAVIGLAGCGCQVQGSS
jgi:hypothetical protein